MTKDTKIRLYYIRRGTSRLVSFINHGEHIREFDCSDHKYASLKKKSDLPISLVDIQKLDCSGTGLSSLKGISSLVNNKEGVLLDWQET